MARLELILVVLFIAFTIFAFVDCLRTEDSRVRALPKYLWLVLIVILTPFGGILWLLIGKDRADRSPVRHSNHGPDDDPAFLRQLAEDKRREERIRELEARLAELDDDQNNSKDK
ncbi:MAG: hypothetical protein QOI70_857 [Microbacteriaceae bacterium]|jgi:hypothetical protein|nr:hypothetical protein [Microbacteriaceae bacterium]